MLRTVWSYLAGLGRPIREDPLCLCRKIVRWSGVSMSLGQMLTCLDIFHDVNLLQFTKLHKHIAIELTAGDQKADLTQSKTMQALLRAKES